MLLASFPSPPQSVLHIGPLPLRAYALFIVVGVLVGVRIGERRWQARGGTPGVVADLAVYGVPAGVLGARAYHVATDWADYRDRPLEAFAIWQGGLGIWGGVAAGVLVAVWVGRRRGVRASALIDAVAPGIAVAQAIGRIGNYFNQELYGRATTLPWAVEIDPAHRPAATPDVATYHPAFLYEALANLAVAAVVVLVDRRRPLRRGRAFALYVALYTVGRFLVERLRIDPATQVGGWRINEVVSVVVFALAVGYLVLTRRADPEKDDLPVQRLPDGAPDREPDGEADRPPA